MRIAVFMYTTHGLSGSVDGRNRGMGVMAHLRHIGVRSIVPAMACVEVVLHLDHRMPPTVRYACHVRGSRCKRSVHLVSSIRSFDLFGPVRCWVDGIGLVISVGHFPRWWNSRKRGGEGRWGRDSPSDVQVHPTTAQMVFTIEKSTHDSDEDADAIYMR